MGKRVRLTTNEIKALLAAAGNIDPCMFTEADDAAGLDAYENGMIKLREMLAQRREPK